MILEYYAMINDSWIAHNENGTTESFSQAEAFSSAEAAYEALDKIKAPNDTEFVFGLLMSR